MTEKKERNNDSGVLEVVFIMDRSGSMYGKEEDTIGGFNSLLKKQQEESGNVIWSTVLFDDEYEVLHDRVPIKEMEPITEEEYYVRGCTALLDAVGKSITHIRKVHKIEKEKAPKKTMFVITTDGYENASCEYSQDKVKELIREQEKEHGWEFIFMGAGIDSVSEGGSIGISATRCVDYLNDAEGTALSFEAIGTAMYNCCYMEDPDIGACFDSVREDYQRRKNSEIWED